MISLVYQRLMCHNHIKEQLRKAEFLSSDSSVATISLSLYLSHSCSFKMEFLNRFLKANKLKPCGDVRREMEMVVAAVRGIEMMDIPHGCWESFSNRWHVVDFLKEEIKATVQLPVSALLSEPHVVFSHVREAV